ncbi:MAG TPA: nitroreductase family deazaflavin-dependent oxidoreductase [Homoserinimonas sp.]|nr:nitroreductase family deazaflavin-dependent oxidoreductase [Homoserinimonas sp.]
MKIRDWLADVLLKAMNAAHRAVLQATGGRVGWKLGRMTAVELHTIGRSTGQRRSTMLSAPIRDGDRFVLVASKGGDNRNPEWYLNLVANSEVELTVRDQTFRMHARTATPAEKAELWPTIVRVNPGYAGYQRKTERDIPVVICEPVLGP